MKITFNYISALGGDRREDGYVFFRKQNNKLLFKQLELDGFFEFHSSNSGEYIVSRHQVVAFYYCGGKEALENGYTCIHGQHEIHHLDGVPGNDHPNNLRYLTVESHREITKIQNETLGLNNFISEISILETILPSPNLWNRRGKAVKSLKGYMANILALTLTFSKKAVTVSKTQLIRDWAIPFIQSTLSHLAPLLDKVRLFNTTAVANHLFDLG